MKDLIRYAESMEMELDEAINYLLKGALKRDKEVLKKEENEVFQRMLEDNIHPDLQYMFNNIDDIVNYMND